MSFARENNRGCETGPYGTAALKELAAIRFELGHYLSPGVVVVCTLVRPVIYFIRATDPPKFTEKSLYFNAEAVIYN
jgi:hypothetical protein